MRSPDSERAGLTIPGRARTGAGSKLRTALRVWRAGGLDALRLHAVEALRVRLGLDVVEAATATAQRELAELTRRLEELASESGRRAAAHERSARELQLALDTIAMTAWVEQAELREQPLVSVIVPTRNRAALLRRAIGSVRAQSYPHWELVVVDDASEDGTTELLASLATELGERLTTVRLERNLGCCAARNRGLSAAKGAIVTYLDDDNRFHPGWLKAVAWAFGERPDAEVVHGAFVVDDLRRVNGGESGSLPRLFLHPFDRRTLARDNLADTSTIAHRAGLAEAVWDESLREMGDWDLFVRLTARREPVTLPAVACFYSTDAPDRLSGGPTHGADFETVRARAAASLERSRR